MYYLLHPISFLNFLVAKVFTHQISFIISFLFFLYIGRNYKSVFWKEVDQRISNWGLDSPSIRLRAISKQFSIFGNAIFHIVFSIILAVILFFLKHNIGIPISIVFTLIFSWGINRVLKLLYKRQRPEILEDGVKKRLSFCFPSGHVMASIAIYFFSSVVLQSFIPFLPWYLFSLIICYFITMSRIFLNHHFFTDILGGISMGIIILQISIWMYFIIMLKVS